MNNLLKEAIADAKAVRETAMANAKIALEEAFTPRLQSMLSARLAEEADEDTMEEEEEEMEMSTEGYENEEDGMPSAGPAMEEDEEEMSDDLDLEEIIRELEGEMGEEPMEEEEEADVEMSVEPAMDEDEDVNIEEIIRALREEDDDTEEEPVTEGEDEDEDPVAEGEEDSEDLKEAYRVIRFMKSKLNEVNLLNAKLLFSNKLFRNYSLNESQKMKVIENFDRAASIREVKLVYSTLCESFGSVGAKKKQQIKESYASKPAGKSTAPKKEILSEGFELAARWKKLANLK